LKFSCNHLGYFHGIAIGGVGKNEFVGKLASIHVLEYLKTLKTVETFYIGSIVQKLRRGGKYPFLACQHHTRDG